MIETQPTPLAGPSETPCDPGHATQTLGVQSATGTGLSLALGLVCFPCTLFSCFTVDVMTETLVFNWGRYVSFFLPLRGVCADPSGA